MLSARSLAPLLLGVAASTSAWSADRMNVLFIAVDDLNHWASYTGRNPQALTPNLDRLSARGVSFTNAHCLAPACEPSRAALMTGMRPSSTGCYRNGDKWQTLIPEGRGLSAAFKRAGYFTSGAGKIYHLNAHHPDEWDHYDGDRTNPAGKIDKHEAFFTPLEQDLRDEDLRDWHTAQYVIDRLGEEREEPFFLACGIYRPHLPFVVPRKYYDLFDLDEIELPPFLEEDLEDVPPIGKRMAKPNGDHAKFVKLGRWKHAIRSYLASVAYADMNVGRVLDALDASGKADETIVVLWGDHGWHFGEKHHWRKFTLWEEATRAPLIWSVPGVTAPGSTCDRPVDFLTIFPTLCDLAGIETPQHVEGDSIRGLLDGRHDEYQGVAITTHGYENHAVRTDRWRYIRYADGTEELYDHQSDPYEWTNLAEHPEWGDLKRELAQHLPNDPAPRAAAPNHRRNTVSP